MINMGACTADRGRLRARRHRLAIEDIVWFIKQYIGSTHSNLYCISHNFALQLTWLRRHEEQLNPGTVLRCTRNFGISRQSRLET